jgi:hypothetical protein
MYQSSEHKDTVYVTLQKLKEQRKKDRNTKIIVFLKLHI